MPMEVPMQQLDGGMNGHSHPTAKVTSLTKLPEAFRSSQTKHYWKRSLLDLFVAQAGITETPSQYIKWMAFQLVSAAVGDRVYAEIFRDLPLAPNLYVCLLGPSGIGKGLAMREVTKFTKKIPIVGTYQAAGITAKGIVDKFNESMGTPREPDSKPVLEAPWMFLVTPELGQAIGTGPLAEDFVKWMTGLYEGSLEQVERTRMHGEYTLDNICMNWSLGTTRDWCVKSIDKDAIIGGFFARVATVNAGYPDVGIWEPKYPRDRDAIIEHLHERVRMLAAVRGKIRISSDADEAGRMWYAQRSKPTDPSMYAVFQRERALITKVATDFVLAELREPDPKLLLMKRRHWIDAQRAVRETMPAVQSLAAFASTTPETRGLEEVSGMIREAGVIKHSVLIKLSARTGLGRQRVDSLLQLLQQSGEVIKASMEGTKSRFWRWKKSTVKFEDDVADEGVEGSEGVESIANTDEEHAHEGA